LCEVAADVTADQTAVALVILETSGADLAGASDEHERGNQSQRERKKSGFAHERGEHSSDP
jgi:hypothetical protein